MLGEEGERRGVGLKRKAGWERPGVFIAGSGSRKQYARVRLCTPRRHIYYRHHLDVTILLLSISRHFPWNARGWNVVPHEWQDCVTSVARPWNQIRGPTRR